MGGGGEVQTKCRETKSPLYHQAVVQFHFANESGARGPRQACGLGVMESELHCCSHFPTSDPFPNIPPPLFVPPNATRARRPITAVTSAITSAAGCGTGRLLLGPSAPNPPLRAFCKS